MRPALLVTAAAVALCAGMPAAAAVVSLASNVDLSAQPYVVHVDPATSYTFSFAPNGLSDVALSMAGTAQVYGNGFFSPNQADALQLGTLVPTQLSLGQFFQQTGTQPIAYSIALVNVALSFVTGGQTYYGYAQVGGSFLTQFAFNDTPGGSITTGEAPAATAAVPEPASWTMMLAGFGMLGAMLRRRRAGRAPAALAA